MTLVLPEIWLLYILVFNTRIGVNIHYDKCLHMQNQICLKMTWDILNVFKKTKCLSSAMLCTEASSLLQTFFNHKTAPWPLMRPLSFITLSEKTY